ncbi:hypothetical protein FACS1894110_19720 [Spirochaetia bacterium]|nr:hypothetical protein FACS1894110_19720 [Spirochaetia bacterium]
MKNLLDQNSECKRSDGAKQYITRKYIAKFFGFSISYFDRKLRKLKKIVKYEVRFGNRVHFDSEVIEVIKFLGKAEARQVKSAKSSIRVIKTSSPQNVQSITSFLDKAQNITPGIFPIGYFPLPISPYPYIPGPGFAMGQGNISPKTDEVKDPPSILCTDKDGKSFVFPNTQNDGNGPTPFDVGSSDKFSPFVGNGINSFDINLG